MTYEINDKDVTEWLEECRSESTRNLYRYGLGIFLKWLETQKHLTITDYKAMTTKERIHNALLFQNSTPTSEGRTYKSKRKRGFKKLEPKPLSSNAINSVLTALQSFTQYLDPDRPLPLRGKRVQIEADTSSHYFSNGDLARLYDYQDAKGKAIIAVASACGFEVSALLNLDRNRVEQEIKRADQENREFIFFEQTRGKTKVKRLCVLNPLAIQSLKEWLPQNPTETLFDMTKSGITKFMRRACKKANLQLTGRVRFHKIRAWTYNQLIRAGLSSEEAKFIIGKKIPVSDSTYLRLKQGIEEKYPKVYDNYLNIKPLVKARDIEEAKTEIQKRKSEYEQLEKRVVEQQKMIETLMKTVAKQALPRKTK
jgi:integrase